MPRLRTALPLILIVGSAFLTGWLMGRSHRQPADTAPGPALNAAATSSGPGSPAGQSRAGIIGQSASAGPAGQASSFAPESGDFPGVSDPLVLAALHNPDLVAGVREIMARQEEDHCADTRMVQLVEALPESRLAELPALLTAFAGDGYVTKFILMPWAERQPEAAMAYVNSPDASARSAELLPHLLTGWTRRDPDAAASWMESLPLSSHSRTLQTTLIASLSESDPDRALSLMREKGWTTNASAIQALLKNQGSRDPAAALETLRSLVSEFGAGSKRPANSQDPFIRPETLHPQFSSLLGALLSGASSRTAADFSDLLAKLSPQEIEDGASSLFTEGLNIHPEIAESILSHTPPSRQDRALAKALAENDGSLAISLLAKTSDPALRMEMLQNIRWDYDPSGFQAVSSLDSNPQARQTVMETLSTLPESARTEAGSRLVLGLGARSPELAGQIWSQLPAAEQTKNGSMLFKNMAGGSPGSSQAAVALWKGSSPEIQSATLRGLTAGLALTNPQQGVDLAMSQSDPRVRSEALATALGFWADQDFNKAAAALDRLRSQVNADELSEALVHAGEFQSGVSSTHYGLSNTTQLIELLKPQPTAAP